MEKIKPSIHMGDVKSSDGEKIVYTHYRCGHNKLIVVAHGFFASKDAELFKNLCNDLAGDYDVIAFDFRGHGKSSGWFAWTAKEYRDLEAILQYASKTYQHIGVIGFSLGAATGIITASKTALIKSLIAVSAPSQFNLINFHFWKINLATDIFYNIIGGGRTGKGVRPGPFWLPKDKPIDSVRKLTMPAFFIHGDADWLIRPRHSKRLFRAANEKKRLQIIRGGLHAEYLLLKNNPEMLRLIKEWFSETL